MLGNFFQNQHPEVNKTRLRVALVSLAAAFVVVLLFSLLVAVSNKNRKKMPPAPPPVGMSPSPVYTPVPTEEIRAILERNSGEKNGPVPSEEIQGIPNKK